MMALHRAGRKHSYMSFIAVSLFVALQGFFSIPVPRAPPCAELD